MSVCAPCLPPPISITRPIRPIVIVCVCIRSRAAFMATKEVRVLQKDLPAPDSGVHIKSSTHYYTRSVRRDVEARRRRGTGEVVLRAAKDCGHGHRTMCGHGPRLTASQPRHQGWSAGAPSGRAVRGGRGWQGAAMALRRASQSGGAPGREEAAGPEAAGALGRVPAIKKFDYG